MESDPSSAGVPESKHSPEAVSLCQDNDRAAEADASTDAQLGVPDVIFCQPAAGESPTL